MDVLHGRKLPLFRRLISRILEAFFFPTLRNLNPRQATGKSLGIRKALIGGTIDLQRNLNPTVSQSEEGPRFPPTPPSRVPQMLQRYKDVIFYPPPLFHNPMHSMAVFKNARIVGSNPIAISESNELIEEALFRDSSRNRLALSYLSSYELNELIRPSRQLERINGPVVLLASFWDNFGHWIPEHLPKINLLNALGCDLSSMRFIVRDPDHDYKKFLMAAAGLRQEQIIPWSSRSVVVEELIVPNYPQVSVESLEWINSLVPDSRSNNVGFHPEGNRLYLSRQKWAYRKFRDPEVVNEILDRYQFQTVHPEELSFQDQVSISRSASALFGVQGSQMTLQIFMDPGNVLEAFGRDRIHLFNRQVAEVKGHAHFPITDSRGPTQRGVSGKEVVLDPAFLVATMESIFH